MKITNSLSKKGKIKQDVLDCRNKLGYITRDIYREKGKYPIKDVYKLFGNWTNLIADFNNKDGGNTLINKLSIKELKNAIRSDYISIHNKLGKIPTLRDIEKHSSFSKRQVYKAFESLEELKEYCDISEERNIPKKLIKEFIQNESQEEYKIYIDEVLSYRNKYNVDRDKDHKILMVGSDWHDMWVDPFALDVWVKTVKETNPDYICFAGDVFDFYQISLFSKDPRRIFNLQKEIDFVVKKIFKPTREAAPNAQIDLLIGNHEFRLIKFLMAEAQALASLRCLRFGELFRLDENKINLVCHERFVNNKHINKDRNYKIYDGTFLVTHGISVSNTHAMNELQKWGMSGCSGHVHRHQEARINKNIARQTGKDIYGELKWISLGAMCKTALGYDYIEDLVKWNKGFLVTHLFPKEKEVINNYIEIVGDKAVVGNRIYRRGKKSEKC